MMGLLTTLITGGATGLIGTLFSGLLAYFERKQRQGHELAVMEMEIKASQQEWSARQELGRIEAEKETEVAAQASFRESMRSAATRWSSGDSQWIVAVDVIRGMIRPVLTVGTWILIGVLYFDQATAALEVDGVPLQVRVALTILFLGEVSFLWWFGERRVQKAFGK